MIEKHIENLSQKKTRCCKVRPVICEEHKKGPTDYHYKCPKCNMDPCGIIVEG